MSKERLDSEDEHHVRQWSRGRMGAVIFCLVVAACFLILAHQLENDPTAEARFAVDPNSDPVLTRANIPWLRRGALGLCAVTILIAVATRPQST